jgi:hypothetical protein
MNKAVYIGAGTDILPALLFLDLKEFIFIDSQPFSEFGTHTYHVEGENHISIHDVLKKDRFDNLFSRPNFLPSLEKVMNQNNFQQSTSTPDFILYHNLKTKQTIKYYYSCSFPEYLDSNIIQDIKGCNTIIVCGHHPNKVILNYLQSPTYLIGNSRTVYKTSPDEDDYKNSLIKSILENSNLISRYFLIKHLEDYEWWESDTLIPSVITKYNIVECSGLEEIEKIRRLL